MPIKVVIADDHTIFREGLRRLLETKHQMVVVGEASDGEEAVAVARQTAPDVVLMDISMVGGDGIIATARLTAQENGPGVVFLTEHVEETYFLRAVGAGARGYVTKTTPSDELARVLRTVAAGKSQFDPDQTRRLATAYHRIWGSAGEARRERLTDRQLAILRILTEGASNRDIAE